MNATATILVVDDEVTNRLLLNDVLSPYYRVLEASDGEEAWSRLLADPAIDLILSDVMMPRLDGFALCRRIKNEPRFSDIPFLFLTTLDSEVDETHGLLLGASDFIHKPISPPIVLARVRNHLELARARAHLAQRNAELEALVLARSRELLAQKQRLIAAQGTVITAFCTLAEVRDNETGNHILRTQRYVAALAERLRRHPCYAPFLDDDETIRLLFKSAPLHDIGKVAIPDAILLKPGPLDEAEWVIMKRHTDYGRLAILEAERELGENESFLRYAREIAYSHHEKWDGSGYPLGLAGEDIPLSARLMAVADVYDALISRRVYKPPIPHAEAVGIILAGAGSHFDPAIVDAFAEIQHEFAAIAASHRDGDARPAFTRPVSVPAEPGCGGP